MHLYLVRHTHALPAEENPLRPLSVSGRDGALRIAGFLAATAVFRPAQYWHSPLARAGETARLLATAINPASLLVETDGLLPEDNPEAMARRLADYPAVHDVALVGHEPHLSLLAALLVRGKAQPDMFDLCKGTVLALERSGYRHKKNGLPRWSVRWQLSPDLLPARDGG